MGARSQPRQRKVREAADEPAQERPRHRRHRDSLQGRAHAAHARHRIRSGRARRVAERTSRAVRRAMLDCRVCAGPAGLGSDAVMRGRDVAKQQREDRPEAGSQGREAAARPVRRRSAEGRGERPESAEAPRPPRRRRRPDARPLAAPEPPAAPRVSAKTPRVTAESLASKQREISVSEFFAKNRHLLGFDNPSKALLTTIKEAVDNSLDACEEAGILPELRVEVHDLGLEAMKQNAELTKGEGRFLVVVEDNGPGIVKAQVPKIFGKLLYGSKFHRLRQMRGQQGIGISAAAMYGQITTGKPIRVTSRVGKRKPAHVFDIQLDTRKNEPVVTHDEMLADWHQEHGTRVELEIVANWQTGQRFVNRYVEHTALANPHAAIHYTRPVAASQRSDHSNRPGNETLSFPRAANELPKEAVEIKPHPHGVELGALMLLARESKSRDVRGFLQTAFSRVSSHAASDILAKVPWGKKVVRPRVLGDNRVDGRGAAQGHRRDKAHEPPHELPEPDRRRADAQGARQLPARDRERGRVRGREHPARPRLRGHEAGAKGRGGQGRQGGEGRAGGRAGGPRRAARGGRREDQGPQLLHCDGHSAAQGLPRQPVPGRGGPRLRRQLAARQDDRAVPLRQPRAAAVPARRLRRHRGDRAHRLAQLPAEPAQGVAAGGADGAARPHRLGLGAVHQRVEGGRRPLPGHHQGDPARGAGVRQEARHLHPQAQGRRLPGAAAQHLRALHRGGGRRDRQDHGHASPGPSSGSSCRSRTRSPRRSCRKKRRRRSSRRARRKKASARAEAEE